MPSMEPLRREDHPELEALFAHYDRTLDLPVQRASVIFAHLSVRR